MVYHDGFFALGSLQIAFHGFFNAKLAHRIVRVVILPASRLRQRRKLLLGDFAGVAQNM